MVGDQSWSLPSSAQCLRCHTEAAGRSLGLETMQLNRSITYPNGRTSDQLSSLDHIGMFTEPLIAEGSASADLPTLPEWEGLATTSERARAYLHTNCSMCHRPDTAGGGDMDLRFSTALLDMNICEQTPSMGDLGLSDAVLIRPDAPEDSVLLQRMITLDAQRMPPIASQVRDEAGVALIEDWILGLEGCE